MNLHCQSHHLFGEIDELAFACLLVPLIGLRAFVLQGVEKRAACTKVQSDLALLFISIKKKKKKAYPMPFQQLKSASEIIRKLNLVG